eukprot:TRINITY_DN24777_c0_g1_i1.p1 TRINITY_DN24777_c0_g1~~TRINITY_DN24777_c0_g1_i1.p1  ORF type:complete len:178 (-),score=46.59 TRINITY_DN24777_c0_g1_i1:258-791(-)
MGECLVKWDSAIDASYIPARVVEGFTGPELVDDDIIDADNAVPRDVLTTFLEKLQAEVRGQAWTVAADVAKGKTEYDGVEQECTRYTSARGDRMEVWRGGEGCLGAMLWNLTALLETVEGSVLIVGCINVHTFVFCNEFQVLNSDGSIEMENLPDDAEALIARMCTDADKFSYDQEH